MACRKTVLKNFGCICLFKTFAASLSVFHCNTASCLKEAIHAYTDHYI